MPLLKHAKKFFPKRVGAVGIMRGFGYKRVEAAKLLGAPVSTVNWQYNNILKKLGKSFKEVYDVRD